MLKLIQTDFLKAQKLIQRVSWPLRLSGFWPTDKSFISKLKYLFTMTYLITHVIMEYCNFISVFKNLDLMILNFITISVQTITIVRLAVLKYNKIVLSLIETMEAFDGSNCKNHEEKIIYIYHSSRAIFFFKISFWFCFASAINWYFTPLQNFLFALIQNETAILEIPYPIQTFFDISSMERIVFVYIYEVGVGWSGLCYASTFGVIIAMITSLCTRLALLSHRIMNLQSKNTTLYASLFHDLVVEHMDIIRTLNTFKAAYDLLFLYELLNITLLISLILYYTLMTFDDAEMVDFISSAVFTFAATLSMYGYCLAGQWLESESIKLGNTYWHCQWYDMPVSCKKNLIICMIFSQTPLHLTAGGFYNYSLMNFTSILKTAMAYVSMLRTVHQR
uniref:Odorant receptor n=1 Tax=Aulacocentrum confusum TaxID=2767324 RepID=A0A7G8Z949_9HYME|nr:olfactory receptor 30 [Aulacocentrum confusum]